MHIALIVQRCVFTGGVYPHDSQPVGSIFGMIDGVSVQFTGTPDDLLTLGGAITGLAHKLAEKMEDAKKIPLPTE